MYYGLIILSVVMFGTSFFFQDEYRKIKGNSFKISLQFLIEGSIAGFVVLLAINKFKLGVTPFTLIMSTVNAANALGLGFCTFKALDKVNLSVCSVFSMLGGMVLPFVQGIIFYGETVTVPKFLCLILIAVALFLTVEKGGTKGGAVYYAGVFILNGMSGVLSKLYNELPFDKADAASYTILTSIISVVIAAALMALFCRKNENEPKTTFKSVVMSVVAGALNKIGNFILVVALIHVDASVQYPMVTGGMMIVSTIYCLIGGVKPTKKEILSVIIAFAGMLVLLF